MSTSYKIRLKTDQFEIEVESTEKEFVSSNMEKHLQLLKNAEVKPGLVTTRPNSAGGAVKSTLGKALSVQEFLNDIHPSSGPEFVVAIGFYLEKHQGLPSFNSSQIKAEFLRAKYQHPNPTDAILKARASGKVMDGAERGTYILTRTGEQWVEARLSNKQ